MGTIVIQRLVNNTKQSATFQKHEDEDDLDETSIYDKSITLANSESKIDGMLTTTRQIRDEINKVKKSEKTTKSRPSILLRTSI